MYQLARIVLLIAFAASSIFAQAQTNPVDEAKAAIARMEYVRAVNLLTPVMAQPSPPADAYVYLGIAYAHTREWKRAEDTLKLGAERFPKDPRFHNELAGVYLAANDLDKARDSLRQALAVDPGNKYASDLLATIDMSMGNVHAALDAWNRDGHPIVGEILHNGHVEAENWVIGEATAFKIGEKLTWAEWRTTEERLWESDIFSNVGVEIEPTPVRDRYTAIIRTSENINDRRGELINAALGSIFFGTPELNGWNVKNTGISLSGNYRFWTNRHRADVGLRTPIPRTGPLFLEAQWIWRSEGWNVSQIVVQPSSLDLFTLKTEGILGSLKLIPHYRVELGIGYQYRNRRVQSGTTVSREDTGKLIGEVSFLPLDRRIRTRIFASAYIARPALLSQLNYNGGWGEVKNRYVVSADRAAYFDVDIRAGTARGQVPIDDYWVLGLNSRPESPLRGHNAWSPDGHFGNAPMGTDFVVLNTTFERRIRRMPLFNFVNTPYVDLKWQVFLDGGQNFDQAGVFKQDTLFIDIGGGFKLDMPTKSVNITYGQSLRTGTGVFAIYMGKRW